jgi:hypothetical protein
MYRKSSESLPKEQADKYKFEVHMKKRIRIMLNFLLLEKSNIPVNLRGQLPMFVKNIQDVLHPYRRKKVQMAELHTGCHSQILPNTLLKCVIVLSVCVKNTRYKLRKTLRTDCDKCNIQDKTLNTCFLGTVTHYTRRRL